MGKAGKSLLKGAKEALDYAKGINSKDIKERKVNVPANVDVKSPVKN